MNGVIIQYTRYFAVVSWHALADLTTLTESKRESAIANFRVGYPHTPPNSLLLSGRMSTVAPSTPKRDGKAKLAAESPDSVTTSTMSDMSSEPEASLGVVPTKKGISGPSHALSGLGSGLGIMRGGLFSGAAALVAAPVVGVQKGVEAGGGEKKSTGGERSLQPISFPHVSHTRANFLLICPCVTLRRPMFLCITLGAIWGGLLGGIVGLGAGVAGLALGTVGGVAGGTLAFVQGLINTPGTLRAIISDDDLHGKEQIDLSQVENLRAEEEVRMLSLIRQR